MLLVTFKQKLIILRIFTFFEHHQVMSKEGLVPITPTFLYKAKPFKRQSHKMAKRTQTIRRQIADAVLEYVWSFC